MHIKYDNKLKIKNNYFIYINLNLFKDGDWGLITFLNGNSKRAALTKLKAKIIKNLSETPHIRASIYK